MKTILLLFTLLPFWTFAQKDRSAKKIESLGIVFTPEYGYRSLNYHPSHQWIRTLRNQTEVANSGFSTGVKINLRSKYEWNLETGLLFANKSYKTKAEDLTWIENDGALPATAQTIFRFKFLSIPLNIHYRIASLQRFTVTAVAGISTNLRLSTKTKVIIGYSNGDETSHASTKQVGYSTFSLSGQIGATINCQLTHKFTLLTEPVFTRSISSINVDDHAKEYLYAFGIGLGARYKL